MTTETPDSLQSLPCTFNDDPVAPLTVGRITLPSTSLLDGGQYVGKDNTDIAATFRRLGWKPPSGKQPDKTPSQRLAQVERLLEELEVVLKNLAQGHDQTSQANGLYHRLHGALYE